MKVHQLIEELKGLPPNSEIIIQKDPEGYNYSPLYCVDSNSVYVPGPEGVVYSLDWTAEEALIEEDEWEEIQSREKCVVLVPNN